MSNTGSDVTNWEGKPIKYNGLTTDEQGQPIAKTSLIAARKETHAEVLKHVKP